jgi:membrane-bound inhibitor of C-type lysozyme
MKRKIVIAIAVVVLIMTFVGCSTNAKAKLSVELDQEVEYQCSDGSKVNARFYTLTDNSLSFVKIKITKEKEYTLPQVIAASGVRYSDEYSIQIWTKGNEMTLYKMNEDREWEIIKEGVGKK